MTVSLSATSVLASAETASCLNLIVLLYHGHLSLDYDNCLLTAYPNPLVSFAVCCSSSMRAVSKKIFQTL